MMDDDEPATLDSQFAEFARFTDFKNRDGTLIRLRMVDFWLRQARVLDDRRVTMTDTGVLFNKYEKSEINWDEWNEFLAAVIHLRELGDEETKEALINCGIPGSLAVVVPEFKEFFKTYKPKEKLPF